MLRCVAAMCLCVSVLAGWSQENQASMANSLYLEGKKVDALPLYEELAKSFPKEWLYQERLADCLAAKSSQTTDAAEGVAVRTRMRDAAKQAVALGDPNYYLQVMASIDPAQPLLPKSASPGASLLQEGEKAYGAGDFATAIAKYSAAADADPRLYDAPLFAGDTAFLQKEQALAGKWYARAIAIDPNRETAYRYWGDALLQENDLPSAKEKFIAAVIAEPYNKMSWQGLSKWVKLEKAVMLAPRIDRPAGPTVDAKNPNNVNIQIDFAATDEKRNPGASAWMMYSIVRASYHGDLFAKEFPNEKAYRHTLKEESAALSLVASSASEKKVNPKKLDESLRNLIDLEKAGMLDCWILVNGADEGIAQDYDAYRREHRQLLHDYVARFVVHGGVAPSE